MSHFPASRFLIVVAVIVATAHSTFAQVSQPLSPPQANQIVMDVFVRSDKESASAVSQYVGILGRRVKGLEIRTHDVLKDPDQLRRLYALSKRVGRPKPVLPAFYTCDRMYFGFADARQTGPSIEAMLTAKIYARSTCPRCQKLKAFLPQLQQRWPAIRFVVYDVDQSTTAMQQWKTLCQQQGRAPGLPTIDFARRTMVGYQSDEITGAQLEELIRSVSGTEAASNVQPTVSSWHPSGKDSNLGEVPRLAMLSVFLPLHLQLVSEATTEQVEDSGSLDASTSSTEGNGTNEEDLPDLLMLPEEASDEEIGEATVELEAEKGDEIIEVPLLGKLNASELGMPLFTLAVGLVDGFNPCAMWVLVFLLSVLVNIKDRRKILAIAGTFVIISGLAYFAFMAAWLSVFTLLGFARPVQIALAIMAVLIGVVNIKDFFAFKKGITLSIPESQKKGLYRRVRQIVSAKYLSVAIGSAVVLAVLVNMIELLCTAGLPALYTQILTMQDYPAWKNYAYLGLYIGAYMFDDAVLVAIVIVTLSHRKLQEREGRWLKLLSGLVILALGIVMLFKPEWLHLGS